jgi:hypothetical protein
MLISAWRFTLALGLLGSALSLAWQPSLGTQATHDQEFLHSYVGQVARKCCLPGRRWGCDPQNFQQTGCVHIDTAFPECQAAPMVTVPCTSAVCQDAGSEDVCDMRIRTVGMNRCQPLGTKTTVGCPPDHWQCNIRLYRYTLNDAPKTDVFVCNQSSSTICAYQYSVCD